MIGPQVQRVPHTCPPADYTWLPNCSHAHKFEGWFSSKLNQIRLNGNKVPFDSFILLVLLRLPV